MQLTEEDARALPPVRIPNPDGTSAVLSAGDAAVLAWALYGSEIKGQGR